MKARDLLATDKLMHMAVGLTIVLLFGPIHPALGMAVCTVTAWGKERFDYLRPANHTTDGWDAFATVLGGVIALGALALLGLP